MSSENGENRGGELPDEQADALLDQLAARADERDDIDLRPASKRTISRRSLLGAVGAAGAGALALGSGNAEAQTGQWGNATGSAGTESKPFSEAWVQDLYSESINTNHPNSDNGVRVAHHESALSEGYLLGWCSGYTTIIDPLAYGSDAAAMQAVIDELIAEMPTGVGAGELWIPPQRPDGTEFEVGTTVECSTSSAIVLPQGWGFDDAGSSVQCSITDGSPMFLLDGGHTVSTQFGGLNAQGNGNDAQYMKLVDLNAFDLSRQTDLGGFDGATAPGVIEVGGSSFGWFIDNIWYNAGQGTESCIRITDAGGNRPGNAAIGPKMIVHGCKHGVRSDIANRPIRLSGWYEAAEGDSELALHDGTWVLTDELHVAKEDNNDGSCVFFDGGVLAVSNGANLGIPGNHALHLGPNAGRFYIEPFQISEVEVPGDTIHIDADAGEVAYSSIPFETQVRGSINTSTGSLSDLNDQIRFPNGMAYVDGGTETVSSGGETSVQVYMGFWDQTEVIWSPTGSTDGGTVSLMKSDKGGDYIDMVFQEVDDGGDVEVAFEVYRK